MRCKPLTEGKMELDYDEFKSWAISYEEDTLQKLLSLRSTNLVVCSNYKFFKYTVFIL